VAVFNGLKTPKVVRIEKPQYPPAAKKTGIEGVVIVDATVTAEASVEKVKVAVISCGEPASSSSYDAQNESTSNTRAYRAAVCSTGVSSEHGPMVCLQ
jgi:hypothetical protein